MLKILTVMKSGGEYDFTHVHKIKNMCEEKITTPYEFYCLSDLEDKSLNIIKLQDGLPGWFSKLELFKIVGPCFYIDLDTIIFNNIDQILHNCTTQPFELITLRGPATRVWSGLMYWNHSLIDIYTESKTIYKDYPGDQQLIDEISDKNGISLNHFQEQGKNIVSFQHNLNYGKHFNEKIHDIIFFHEDTRPWNQKVIQY